MHELINGNSNFIRSSRVWAFMNRLIRNYTYVDSPLRSISKGEKWTAFAILKRRETWKLGWRMQLSRLLSIETRIMEIVTARIRESTILFWRIPTALDQPLVPCNAYTISTQRKALFAWRLLCSFSKLRIVLQTVASVKTLNCPLSRNFYFHFSTRSSILSYRNETLPLISVAKL